MFRICTLEGEIFQSFVRPTSRWKCDVETNGTATFLPIRSCGVLMPEPLRATSASDRPMLSRIQKRSISTPRVTAEVMHVDPRTPTGTAPDAKGGAITPAEQNWRTTNL